MLIFRITPLMMLIYEAEGVIYPFLKRLFTYLFLDRGEGREKERNINVWLPLVRPLLGTWPETQACVLTGNQTGDLLVHQPAPNPLSHTSQKGLSILEKLLDKV